jgi:uncharacterized delta-60 repeat protein
MRFHEKLNPKRKPNPMLRSTQTKMDTRRQNVASVAELVPTPAKHPTPPLRLSFGFICDTLEPGVHQMKQTTPFHLAIQSSGIPWLLYYYFQWERIDFSNSLQIGRLPSIFPMLKSRNSLCLLGISATLSIFSCGEKPIPKKLESNFTMAKNSLSFANFAAGFDDAVLNPTSVRKMFGPSVCKNQSSPCELTLAAKAFMNKANKAMNGGRCEGFAVTASLLEAGKLDAKVFGGETARDLELKDNGALQQEIAYWFATQLHPSVTEKTKGFMAKDVMPKLVEALSKDATERFRIGIVKKVGDKISGGHALTPISFFQESEGVYLLRVYDNNLPDAERTMKIDVKKNRWEYEAAENPSKKSSLYYGDDSNKNPLYFAPILSRSGQLACHFCDGNKAQVVSSGGAQIQVNGVGVADGEITQGSGSAAPSFSAENDSDGTSFVVNTEGTEFVVDITDGDDGSSTDTSRASVGVSGNGFSAGVDGLDLSDKDQFSVKNGGKQVGYVNNSRTDVTLNNAVEIGGKSVSVSAKVSGESGNVGTIVDDKGIVTVDAKDSPGSMVTVTVTVETADGGTKSGTLSFTSNGDSSLGTNSKELEMSGTISGTVNNNGMMQPLGSACDDGMKSGMESDVDCGGTCTNKCLTGLNCNAGSDCRSSFCAATSKKCVATQCEDQAKTGDESDVDCGGSNCAKCGVNKACATSADCGAGLSCDNLLCKQTYLLSAVVSGLQVGGNVTLTNATNMETLTISSNDTRAFTTRILGAYNVSITQQPINGSCTLMNGMGTAAADVTLTVTCVPSFQISGSVTGLGAGQSVVLRNNGADSSTVSMDGAFVFSTRVNGAYNVTIQTQPMLGNCTVMNGVGTATSDVTNVAVNCSAGFSIGGTVTGLTAGQTVTLQNNLANNTPVSMNGSFTFSTAVTGAYSVSILTQPVGGNCTLMNATGTATANVTNVAVTCVSGFSISGTVAGLTAGQMVTLQNNLANSTTVSANGAFTFSQNSTNYNITVSMQPLTGTCTVTNGMGTASAPVTNISVTCVGRGTLDTTFNGVGYISFAPNGFQQEWFKVVINPDNSQTWAGRHQIAAADNDWAISKILPNGTFDMTFGTNGHLYIGKGVSLTETAKGIHRNANGSYLVAGTAFDASNHSFAVARVTAAGALDTTFGTAGWAIHDFAAAQEFLEDMKVLSDGSIILVGQQSPGANGAVQVLKLTPAGALDTSFGTGGRYLLSTPGTEKSALAVAIRSGLNDLYIAGWSGSGAATNSLLISLSSFGIENTMFGTNGVLISDLSGVNQDDRLFDVVAEGNIAVCGSANNGANDDYLLAEFSNFMGTPTSNFGGTGKLILDRAGAADRANSLSYVPSTGGYVVGGHSGFNLSVLTFTNAGALDTGFANMGQFQNTLGSLVGNRGYDIALDGNGKIVVGGMVSGGSANNDFGAARVNR